MTAGPAADQPVRPRTPPGVGTPLRAVGRPDRHHPRPPGKGIIVGLVGILKSRWLRGQVSERKPALCVSLSEDGITGLPPTHKQSHSRYKSRLCSLSP